MELPKPAQNSLAPTESSSDQVTPSSSVSLFLRLWTYGGPSQPAVSLPVEQDPEITTLINKAVAEGKGSIADRQRELLAASFDNALSALSVAKTLQQSLLTFHRGTEPQQVVPSILIYRRKAQKPSDPDTGAPEDMLANVTSAQILIAGSIYEEVKNTPGVKFSPKPVREAGESFSPEPIYELLWTDESTYGHLWRASRAGLKTIGRYQVQEELGRGAMGAVYKAYDEVIGRTIALKTIPIDRHAPDRDELIERLKQEAKAAGGLDHPNIITIYDVGQEDDAVYLSMQFVKGTTLAELLDDVGVPSLATFLSWADQICLAVGFAHDQGVIHRDLKPANLMVTEQGVVKVLDFGIAKIGNTSLTQTGLVVGTPSYMSPELLAGKKIDHRADIFALGAVFYELVTREKAFRGDVTTVLYKIVNEDPVAPSLVNPSIPGGIDSVIRKALAKDPKQRFQSCEEMRQAFLEHASRFHATPAAAAPLAPSPKAESQPPPTIPSFLMNESVQKRSNVWPKVAMVAVLALAAAAGWAFYTRSRTGSFPPVVDKLLGKFYDVPQDIHNLNQSGAQTQVSSTSQPSDVNQPGSTHLETEPKNSVATAGSDSSANTAPPSTTALAQGNDISNEAPAATASPTPTSTLTQSSPALTNNSPASTASVQQVSAKQPNIPAAANGNVGSGGSDNAPDSQVSSQNLSEPTPAAKTAEKPKHPARLTVDGFARKDVPELLHLADVAAQRGDYRLAIYEYDLILKLDPGNLTARKKLELVRSAQSTH